jgi:hypothetical protein
MDPIQLDEKDIEGRGLKKPYGSITYDPETKGLRIRLDDEIKEEFWLEVVLRPEVLDRIFADRKPS